MLDSPINPSSAGSATSHNPRAAHDHTRDSPAPGPSIAGVHTGARALAAPFAHIQHVEVPASQQRPQPPFRLPEVPRQPSLPVPHFHPNQLAPHVLAPPAPKAATLVINQPVGPVPRPPPFRPIPLHGPLQAERLAQQATAAAQRLEKEEEKARKAAEKEAQKALKQAEKEEKEAQKRAKEAEKEATKKAKEAAGKGKGRSRGRHAAGNSDDEIADADPDEIASAGIKPIVKNERSKKWSNEEGLRAVGHITHVWKRFKLKQTDVFRHVSESVLLGSKTTNQVMHYWGNCWKKFKECRRREKHTGGGDGDKLDADALHEEADTAEDTGSEEEKKPADKKVAQRVGGQFSPAQLDAFEQSDVYQMILKVASNNPEVVKAEEFDSARPLSDSDSELPAKSRNKQLEDDQGDLELVRKTYDILSASLAGFAEARKANLELANRKEAREQQAESDRRERQDNERQLLKRRLEIDEEAHKATQEREAQRMKLEMQRLELEERDRRMREWDKVEELLRSDNRVLVERGERLARRLQAEEDRMSEHM